jgi:hypothetical protein
MKNIKGYYSWIHSLNQAANKVQTNQQNLLSEATKATSSVGDASGKTTRVKASIPTGSVRPATFSSSADEDQTGRIMQGMWDLIQTINTGHSPDAKKGTKAPNPTLKPSEQLKVKPQSVVNMGKEAREISAGGSLSNTGAARMVFGDEGFDPVADTPSPGPRATPEMIDTYINIRKSKSNPDLVVSDVDGDGDADVKDVEASNIAQHNVTLGNPKFTNPNAAEARIEAGSPAQGDDELVAKGGIPTPAPTMTAEVPAMEPEPEPTEKVRQKPTTPSSPVVSKTKISSVVGGLAPDAEGRATLGGGAKIRVVTRPKPTNESVSQKISKFLGF